MRSLTMRLKETFDNKANHQKATVCTTQLDDSEPRQIISSCTAFLRFYLKEIINAVRHFVKFTKELHQNE